MMSLLVNVFTRDAEGHWNVFDDEEGQEHAGFEACRTKLWGSPAAIALGLTLLPTLAHGDLYAEGTEMERLEREISVVLDNLPELARVSGYEEAYIRARAQNILGAVMRAGQVSGGVVIW